MSNEININKQNFQYNYSDLSMYIPIELYDSLEIFFRCVYDLNYIRRYPFDLLYLLGGYHFKIEKVEYAVETNIQISMGHHWRYFNIKFNLNRNDCNKIIYMKDIKLLSLPTKMTNFNFTDGDYMSIFKIFVKQLKKFQQMYDKYKIHPIKYDKYFNSQN